MAIKIGSNFTFQGKQPNFERDRFATKAAMKAFPETSIDDGHLSYCSEDGNTYQFKSSNSVDAVTGKWRIFKADVNLSAYATKDSVAIDLAKKVDIRGKSYFNYPNKYYFTDLGLRNARLNFRQYDPGHLMENAIYNELIKRGYSVDVGVVVDRRNGANSLKEIDFVVNEGDRRIYIQSVLRMDDEEKIKSELDSFKLTNDFFKKIIIRNDITHNYYDENGIYHCCLSDFLLNRIQLF